MPELNRAYNPGGTPTGPSIGRPEGHQQERSEAKAIERHDHSAVRLNERLAADAVHTVLGRQGIAPREPAICRRAHLLQVTTGVVVELRVTVTVKRAAGSVIAHSPVLVVEMTVGVDDNRRRPGQSAVS